MNLRVAVCKAMCIGAGMAIVPALAAGAPANSDTHANSGAAAEQCGTLFSAKVCTSYKMDAGKVTEFSLHVPLAMLDGAPTSDPMVWPPKTDLIVPFADAVKDQTGFTFSNIYWNPMGHPPAAYMTPHLDFHFYFVPQDALQSFDCKDTTKPSTLPDGYAIPDVDVPGIGTLIGICIPAMGMHAIPAADLTTKNWEGSLLVGYYSGKPIFIEPMITKALLMKKQSFTLPIPAIAPTPNVRYPRQFNAVYDAKLDSYDFTFSY